MGVFDARTIVPRRVEDPITDHCLVPPASLGWKDINTPTGLHGTSGQDCMLIHGNVNRVVSGNMDESYGGNVTTKISGDQSRTVRGSQTFLTLGTQKEVNVGGIKHTIVGSTNRTYIGGHNELQVAGKKHSFLGVLVENHASPKQENEPLHVEVDSISLAMKGVDLSTTGVKGEAVGVSTAAFGLKAEAGAMAVAGVGMDVGATGINVEGKAIGVTAQGVDLNMCALSASVGFVLDCTIDLNSGFDINTSTPFS